MSLRLENRAALVTGAARGMGLAIARRFAEQGADVIAVDRPGADLSEVLDAVRARGRRAVGYAADVREGDAVRAAVESGHAELGRLDIVVANAGIVRGGPWSGLGDDQWQDVLDVDLTGAWHTCRHGAEKIIEGGRGGAIIITNSTAGLRGFIHRASYVAAKHGATGLMKALAMELGPHRVRVNSVHPTRVDTPMLRELLASTDPHNRPVEDTSVHLLPVPWVEAEDIANAALFLASDEARYITGVALPVDAGAMHT